MSRLFVPLMTVLLIFHPRVSQALDFPFDLSGIFSGLAGQIFTVNMATDEPDGDLGKYATDTSDGKCDVKLATPGDQCTLRAAIQQANENTGPNAVTFSLSLPAQIKLSSELPEIFEDLVIAGPGADKLAIDANGTGRVFFINSFANQRLTLSDLTITGGRTLSHGGGILVGGGDKLVMSSCVIKGNSANSGGGGVMNFGSLTVDKCLFDSNTDESGGGGAIYNANTGTETATITNSLFIGNRSTSTIGGGIRNQADATLTLRNSTLNNNSALSGGGIHNDGKLTMKNTIIANSPSGGNCGGDPASFSSQTYNLDSGNSCGFTGMGSLSNADPLLDSVTLTPQKGSPAVDRADNFDCPATDLKGAVRPLDGDGNGTKLCDIGALEFDCGAACETISAPSEPATPPPPSEPATPPTPSEPEIPSGEEGEVVAEAPSAETPVETSTPSAAPSTPAGGGGCSLIGIH